MIYKVRFGKHGFALVTRFIDIYCPNKFGGIGDCVVTTAEGEGLWTGETWVSGDDYLRFSFSSIVSVETRSTLYESDEEWVEIWRRPEKFTYEPWFELARMLKP